jgi:hypothetical protein
VNSRDSSCNLYFGDSISSAVLIVAIKTDFDTVIFAMMFACFATMKTNRVGDVLSSADQYAPNYDEICLMCLFGVWVLWDSGYIQLFLVICILAIVVAIMSRYFLPREVQ